MIHVALAFYDKNGTYARHAGVVIASTRCSTSEPVCFHILHDKTLTDENRNKLKETATSPAPKDSVPLCSIDFVDISRELAQVDSDTLEQISRRFTIGTLFRLTLPEVLPHVDKIIYLDCDIVVALDIAELWNRDLCGRSICAVPLKT